MLKQVNEYAGAFLLGDWHRTTNRAGENKNRGQETYRLQARKLTDAQDRERRKQARCATLQRRNTHSAGGVCSPHVLGTRSTFRSFTRRRYDGKEDRYE